MIREYTNADFEKVNEIGTLITNDFIKKNNLEDMSSKDYLKFFVYDDGIVKGFIQIELHFEIIDIINIAVDKNYQNQGIATNLLNHILNTYKCNKVMLEVRESNTSAISFYKKNEFIEIHRRKKYYGNEDAIIMERSI